MGTHFARPSVLVGVLVLAIGALSQCRAASQESPEPTPLPGTRLSVDELEAQFTRVSAGRRLKPESWPDGGRVAVALSFDIDNAAGNLARGDLRPEALSRGEYGAMDGLPRVLRVLDKHAVPATFFIPAVSAILHPQMIPDILAKERHEIGAHGWIHENLAEMESEAEEKRLLDQSIDYLTEATGRRPVGFRSPGANYSPWTFTLLREAGFLYESTLMASDDAYELLLDGEPSGMVELPIEWLLDDFPYFQNTLNGSLPDPEQVFRVYRSEFDVAYEEGGLYVLTMHPHIIGHRSRAAELDTLIAYMKSKDGVWFATHEQVARYVWEEAE